MTISQDDANVYRESAWRYFQIHAEQRLKLFQFFITISTALLGGSIFILNLAKNQEFLVFLGLFTSFYLGIIYGSAHDSLAV